MAYMDYVDPDVRYRVSAVPQKAVKLNYRLTINLAAFTAGEKKNSISHFDHKRMDALP